MRPHAWRIALTRASVLSSRVGGPHARGCPRLACGCERMSSAARTASIRRAAGRARRRPARAPPRASGTPRAGPHPVAATRPRGCPSESGRRLTECRIHSPSPSPARAGDADAGLPMPGGAAPEPTTPNDVASGARPLSSPAGHPVPRHRGPGAARGDGLGRTGMAAARTSWGRRWQAFSLPRPLSRPGRTPSVITSAPRLSPTARPLPAGLLGQQRLTESAELHDHLLRRLSHGQASAPAPSSPRRRGPLPSPERRAYHQPNRPSHLHHEVRGARGLACPPHPRRPQMFPVAPITGESAAYGGTNPSPEHEHRVGVRWRCGGSICSLSVMFVSLHGS